jgi:hypothetical protein
MLVRRKHLGGSLAQLGAWISRDARGPYVVLGIEVELVDLFVGVDEFVHDLHEQRDCGGTM